MSVCDDDKGRAEIAALGRDGRDLLSHKDCGKVGFPSDNLCKDCIQRRAVDEHFATLEVEGVRAMPMVVKIKKAWD